MQQSPRVSCSNDFMIRTIVSFDAAMCSTALFDAMELLTEARAQDAQCASERSMPSRIAVTKLKAMSREDKTQAIFDYSRADLGNLVRCALAAGISADTLWGECSMPVLCIAAAHDCARALQALLAGGASRELRDKDGRTAAHYAAFSGHTFCLRLLLDAGAQLEAQSSSGATPLLLTAEQGHIDACRLLLSAGASVDTSASEQGTPLLLAAANGHAAVVRMLAVAGAELGARNHVYDFTALHCAAAAGHVDALKTLLSHGANANTACSRFGYTPLMIAVMHKHTPCVRALLPVSDLAITCRQGLNALHVCIGNGTQEAFELLLQTSDVDVRTVQGMSDQRETFNATALHRACSFGQHRMVKALLQCGALRTARDNEQRTPLHHACQHGHLHCPVAGTAGPLQAHSRRGECD